MPTLKPYTEVMRDLEAGLPAAADAGFLGARLNPAQAKLVLLPVPWEATTSYGGGTSRAPEAIRQASHQLDLEDGAFGTPYRSGIAFLPEPSQLAELNARARAAALQVIAALEQGGTAEAALNEVNTASETVNHLVYANALAELALAKYVGLVGGDHSSPLGLIQALAERYPDGFGILHIDAHHDLRAAYEGFQYSHASIFHNVMESCPAVTRLVQVGIRDYSRAERLYREGLGERNRCFYAREMFRALAEGGTFQALSRQIIESLPERVYISFDIDGLEPAYCPSTGTPVPGGLSFDQANYLLEELAHSGRRVIGFDLCEVAPGESEWDANVGARLLYKLCGCLLRSQGEC
jgi:agmatinase